MFLILPEQHNHLTAHIHMTTPILESELVLNNDGSVYHLHLLPEDIADTIILVGDPDRVPEVSRYFDRIEVRKNKREFVTHTGFIGNRRLTVLSTGIGTDNIDIALNELDALVNIDLRKRELRNEKKHLKLIRIGTSGSLQEDIPVDSILTSSHGLGLDSLLHYYPLALSEDEKALQTGIQEQLDIPFLSPYFVASPGTLLQSFTDISTGITATCCGFYAPQGRILRGGARIHNLIDQLHRVNYNGLRISNFEMETAAIYGLAKLLGHDAVSINAILANRVTHQFSTNSHATIDKAIRMVLEKLN
jgi:uridine phosphorylase